MIHSKQQLTLIVLLSDGYTISAAARGMGIGQPSASRMLQAMEEHTGLKLVLRRSGRHGGGATPTEELHMLAKQARKMLANMRAMDELVERVKQHDEAKLGESNE